MSESCTFLHCVSPNPVPGSTHLSCWHLPRPLKTLDLGPTLVLALTRATKSGSFFLSRRRAVTLVENSLGVGYGNP